MAGKKTHFVVLASRTTEEQDKKFVEFLGRKGVGYWHWVPDSWLVDAFEGQVTAGDLRDGWGEIAPDARCLVIRFDEVADWAGKGPTGEGKDMFAWVRSNLKA